MSSMSADCWPSRPFMVFGAFRFALASCYEHFAIGKRLVPKIFQCWILRIRVFGEVQPHPSVRFSGFSSSSSHLAGFSRMYSRIRFRSSSSRIT